MHWGKLLSKTKITICMVLPVLSINLFGKDLGIGIIHFYEHGVNSGRCRSDTMLIFQEPHNNSTIIAKYSQILQKNGYQSLVFPLEKDATKNLIEFAYEESGMPFDSIDATHTWVRVIYGMKSTDIALKGWVNIRPPHNKIFVWPEQLIKHPLFFYPISTVPRFFDCPNGKEIDFKLEEFKSGERKYNYIMHPLKTEGNWLQIRVVTPPDYESTNPRQAILWIKYLDAQGRPLVLYSSRGL